MSAAWVGNGSFSVKNFLRRPADVRGPNAALALPRGGGMTQVVVGLCRYPGGTTVGHIPSAVAAMGHGMDQPESTPSSSWAGMGMRRPHAARLETGSTGMRPRTHRTRSHASACRAHRIRKAEDD